MKVGWRHSDPGYVGGAELTMDEFRREAPPGVEFVDPEEAEVVVIGNCIGMLPEEALLLLDQKRVVRYHHDLGHHEHPGTRALFDAEAEHIFTSPLHRRVYGAEEHWPAIPPALRLPDLSDASPNGRSGTCSLAAWMNPGKGAQLLSEWADRQGPVDVYGGGFFLPAGEGIIRKGEIPHEEVSRVLSGYDRFVFLPSAVEPFGRCVVEAWNAGCRLVTNQLVGARHYIEEELDALDFAADNFWTAVLEG